MAKFSVRLAIAWFVLLISVHADSIYTFTLPSSISVPPGVMGSIQGTLTVIGPDPIYITGAGMRFIPGFGCDCINFGDSLIALINARLTPGVYTFTFATVQGISEQQFVTDIHSILELNLAPGPKGTPSPDIVVSFFTGPPSIGNDVSVRGRVVPVPEPGTLALLGTGLAAIAMRMRRRA